MPIRDALPDDVAALREIYNDAVAHTTAIWNETMVDETNRLAWLQDRLGRGYPVLVATDAQDRVLGYASFGDWRAFEGFRHTVEHSVYVHRDARGSGIGRQLLQALIGRARSLGTHVMVAAIEAGNAASIGLHEQLGFVCTGRMPQVGTKFGRWLDLVFMQLQLDEAEPAQR